MSREKHREQAKPAEPAESLPQTLEEAMAFEETIRLEAAGIREHDDTGEGRELFLSLRPLLRRPIPRAFIRTVPPVEGKPYPSTGVSSVQVLIDRMDNVLTELGWEIEDRYENGGKLATVTVTVLDFYTGEPLFRRSSKGGVNRGTGDGNIHKGSFTNAAKLALARCGPGHEIYVGATDLDPDVSRELAGKAATAPADENRITKAIAKRLVDHAWAAGVTPDRFRLATTRLARQDPPAPDFSDVGDVSTKAKAATALTGVLTLEQAEQLDQWLSDEADKAAQK